MEEQTSQLGRLRRQYFALYPLHRLRLPSPKVLAENQAFLKERIVQDPLLGRHQPDAGYQKTFWRRTVTALEKGIVELSQADPDIVCHPRPPESGKGIAAQLCQEVDEAFYELMADLMISQPVAGPSTPGSTYRTFIYDSPTWSTSPGEERSITLVEELAAIQAGTTGLRTWTAALHLAQHILTDPAILGHKTDQAQLAPILELGSGTGFLSILLSQLGASVIATDLGDSNEVVEPGSLRRTPLSRLVENIGHNTFGVKPAVLELDWTEAQDGRRPDTWGALANERRTVIGADIIYDPDLVAPLVVALSRLLDPGEASRAIIAATVRNEETLALFLRTCRDEGLTADLLSLQPVDPDNPTFWDSALEGVSEVRIFHIHPSAKGQPS